LLGVSWHYATKPEVKQDTSGLQEMGGDQPSSVSAPQPSGGLAEPPKDGGVSEPPKDGGVQEPPKDGGVQEPQKDGGVQEPPKDGVQEPPKAGGTEPASTVAKEATKDTSGAAAKQAAAAKATEAKAAAADAPRDPTPRWLIITFGILAAFLVLFYTVLSMPRFEIYKMLLSSFVPLAVMILFVLGAIVFGLATPTEAAAVGSLGGLILAVIYRGLEHRKNGTGAFRRTMGDMNGIVKESSFLTAKTSAMVCWLFVGSSIFSAAFALLGGQELIERWVLSLGLSKVQFLILSQFIIFVLGWPLEWTEIIVIFMPIFIPLLAHFEIDPLFFGLLVALNLQTAFLSPPVAMAAFYLKGVSPPHVTLNQIFAGMVPFMLIQVLALALLYIFPGIGLWLPQVLYK
jgi:TRAP-type mannitol/chloroaromatic compound transport system permease large subunit